MWETVWEFTGHCNEREDGQHILAGMVSTSVAQACKMEKKEPKDEQMNTSAPGQSMSCHSLYINRIMRLRCCSHQDRGTRECIASLHGR